MATYEYQGKDQNWQDQSTTYWFELRGTQYGTQYDMDGDLYGIVESGASEPVSVDCDSAPLVEGDPVTVAVHNILAGAVTDEMRDNP